MTPAGLTTLTFWGHACVRLDGPGGALVIDPGAFSDGAAALDGASGVLVTHEHPDHVDADALAPRVGPGLPVWAPAGAALVVDGLFLHRRELEGLWDFTVFLDVPFEATAARMAVRDGSHPDPEHPSMARYVQAQRRYFAERAPWERADLVVDNSDVERPVVTAPRLAP